MKTILSFAAAALPVLAVVAWSSVTTHSGSTAEPSAASDSPIVPFELMRTAADLPHQQYDAH